MGRGSRLESEDNKNPFIARDIDGEKYNFRDPAGSKLDGHEDKPMRNGAKVQTFVKAEELHDKFVVFVKTGFSKGEK